MFYICNIVTHFTHTNTLQLRGLDTIEEDKHLFWISFAATTLILPFHLRVVWFSTDPGMIKSREDDFDEV
jgi:hypothetical protein